MMKELILALTAHLSDNGLALYLADAVPEKAAFPYLTAELVSPCQTDAKGSIRLTLWCAGDDANLARMTLHAVLMERFPQRGMVLPAADGRYILRPEATHQVQSGAAKASAPP